MEFIQEYFKIKGIKGKAISLDLSKTEDIDLVSKATKEYDLCLCFKLLDTLEAQRRGSSKELLSKIELTDIKVE